MVSALQKIWHWLELWDTRLFLEVNTVWTNSLLDQIFPWWREPNTWIPFYLFLVVFALMNFKQKAIPWILFAVITLILSDQISSSLVKPFFARTRPCNDAFLMSRMRLLLGSCGGGFSFTSSHAVNHFAFAMFLSKTLGNIVKKWKYVFFVWAASVAYAQVYVGVHYPIDVFCGSLLGCAIGLLTGSFFNRRIGLTLPHPA